MGSPAVQRIFLPAGRKTMVLWSSFLFKTYRINFSARGVQVSWERNSTLPPWHTFGEHDTSRPFSAVVAGIYCNFWITSPVGQTITISG